MSTHAIRQTTIKHEPRVFGYGYEPKSPESPSVQTARAEFLAIILESKPNIVNRLIACYPAFQQLLELSDSVILGLVAVIDAGIPKEDWIQRQPAFLRERALEKFVPNADSLKTLEGGQPLADALRAWGAQHNLSDAWCLDDALTVLREFDVMDEKPMALALLPDSHYFIQVWRRAWTAAVIERRLSGLHGICESSMSVEDRGAFSFTFKDGSVQITVSGPFYKSIAAFKREVNNRFSEADGNKIRGARKLLEHRLNEYLDSVNKITKELNLAKPRNWRKFDEHLRWLVDHQVPPCKTYRQIGRDALKDEATVREAIRRCASVIGLTLRSNEEDKKLGRPEGAKDRRPRQRGHG
jgi:hypothetical protein